MQIKPFKIILLLLVVCAFVSCKQGSRYKYESVDGDMLGVRIYTLENGMKVYLSVNKDQPRIHTFVAVRTGGKNDPVETTGLAHYFEHLMFKGTQNFGTSDYEAEKPLLDQIEELFELHRQTTDEAERRAIYAQIDSVSQEASKFAIPNEYDKLMSAIGSDWTNAFTSKDVTAYMENIPSNEIENWAKIQADRFINPVLRLFHTELETVYEEYNMSLTRDSRTVNDTLMNMLFPFHPYGTQSVLGRGEHLKNPSLINIKNFFDTYYVPNNMAICMAGDLDPDATMDIIVKYFGDMKPKPVPDLVVGEETPMKKEEREVIGLESESVTIGFRLPAARHEDIATLEFIDFMITNGKAGLLDLNLIQKQKILRGGSYVNNAADYSVFMMYGQPKEGQTLEEVRDLLLGQLDEFKKGAFDEALMNAVLSNFRLEKYYQQQEAFYVAYKMLDSFVNQTEWADEVSNIENLSKLSKQDVIDIANKYFVDEYAVVYKREGKPDIEKIDKPSITAIDPNRDAESAFLTEIKQSKGKPIDPVFVDFEKDMSKITAKNNLEILYKNNISNPTFELIYLFEMGNDNDNLFGTAFNYLSYLGTSTKTAEEIKSELYSLACSFGVQATNDRVYVYISGLSDNFEKAVELLEERLADPVADAETYKNLVADVLKSRENAKLNQYTIFSRLSSFAKWGANSPVLNIPSAKTLNELDTEELITRIKTLKSFEHKILYYGPLKENEILETVNRLHNVPETLQPVPAPVKYEEQETNQNTVLLAHYDAKQIFMSMVSKGVTYDRSIEPVRAMYNTYFGGKMSGIVFQEMREARGLAYSAYADYDSPSKPEYSYYLETFIATQNDKMKDAVDAFLLILTEMPESENTFDNSKESLLINIRTQRTLRESVLWTYLNAQKFGYNEDPQKAIFEKTQEMTLADVVNFQKKYIKDMNYTYCILGDTKDLNQEHLNSFGTVKKLSLEDIFGY
ncbi:MAG: insulinase family protein [Marinilabiliaceae bacterium]|nr:insulinase family protein [Marinilabiliaceae bacterium]